MLYLRPIHKILSYSVSLVWLLGDRNGLLKCNIDLCPPLFRCLTSLFIKLSLCGATAQSSRKMVNGNIYICTHTHTRGPFEKFVASPYYSESELYGGAVTVSFSKYLPWQAMHFLQYSTHFSKTCCRPLITSKFFASELPFHGWKSPEIAWSEIWTVWRMF
jgi:hypothetical protein